MHVSFSINNTGILTYINNDPVNVTNIKVLVNPQDGCECSGSGINNNYYEPNSILIGNGDGRIISTSEFTYKDCVLEMKCAEAQIIIHNTTDAIGLGTGGNLTLYGGASINKHVFIGEGLDVNLTNITNVATPINGYDAVNKDYLEALLNSIPLNNYVTQPYNYQQFFILNNNVLSPTHIPYLTISADITVSFIAYIYVNSPTFKSLYTIYSYFNGSVWTYFSRFSGPPLDVDFVVTTTNNKLANVCYTNRGLTGTTSIEYYIYEDIQIKPNTSQFNYMLTKSVIPYDFLNYLYTNYHSIKLHIHVWVNNTTAAYFLIDLLLKENEWIINCDRIGPDIGVYFTMKNKNNLGSLQCVNLNNGSVVARVKEYKILQSFSTFRLLNSTFNGLVPPIDIKTDYCQLYIYVEKPEIHQYAFYTIEGFLFNNEWYTNSSFIGDYLHVSFSINNTGILTYINNDPTYITNIKILMVEPDIFIPLQVQDGGTGNSYLEPYSVLIGNGTGPIINTSEFIYQDCILHMKCPESQIVIYNTTDATGLGTGGNLTLYGGASIDKTLYIGNELYVNNVNITPSIGDFNEHVFYGNNNVAIPEIIPGFIFDTTRIKSFVSHIAITVMLVNEQYDVLVVLKGINTSKGWVLNKEFIGDNLNIQFYCNNNGNIEYTSMNFMSWIYTKMRYKADTTTI